MINIMRGDQPARPHAFESWSERDQNIWSICPKCWMQDPAGRPSIHSIVLHLEGLRTHCIQSDVRSLKDRKQNV